MTNVARQAVSLPTRSAAFEASDAVPVGTRRFRLVAKTDETPDVVSLTMTPVDGGPVWTVLPGQYVCVRVHTDASSDTRLRPYTVTAATESTLRITCKHPARPRVDGAVVTSPYDAEPGAELDITPPEGTFLLPEGRQPIVFFTAGTGITPAVAMLRGVKDDREASLFHVCRHMEDFVLCEEVASHFGIRPNRRLALYLTGESGRPKAGDYASVLRRDADYVLCGPPEFIKTVASTLLKHEVPIHRIHAERFDVGTTLL